MCGSKVIARGMSRNRTEIPQTDNIDVSLHKWTTIPVIKHMPLSIGTEKMIKWKFQDTERMFFLSRKGHWNQGRLVSALSHWPVLAWRLTAVPWGAGGPTPTGGGPMTPGATWVILEAHNGYIIHTEYIVCTEIRAEVGTEHILYRNRDRNSSNRCRIPP